MVKLRARSDNATLFNLKERVGAKEKIADLLLGLTQNQRNWGFGLCFLHLRNVQAYGWNHKRVHRIYHDLSLNLRIKPNKRVNREVP